jgi:hypothetical protein
MSGCKNFNLPYSICFTYDNKINRGAESYYYSVPCHQFLSLSPHTYLLIHEQFFLFNSIIIQQEHFEINVWITWNICASRRVRKWFSQQYKQLTKQLVCTSLLRMLFFLDTRINWKFMLLFHHKTNRCNVNNVAVGNWDETMMYSTTLTVFISTDNTWSALIRYRAAYVECSTYGTALLKVTRCREMLFLSD